MLALARVALMKNTKTNDYEHFMRAAEDVAPSLAIELIFKASWAPTMTW
jgi:hypothetical protein